MLVPSVEAIRLYRPASNVAPSCVVDSEASVAASASAAASTSVSVSVSTPRKVLI